VRQALSNRACSRSRTGGVVRRRGLRSSTRSAGREIGSGLRRGLVRREEVSPAWQWPHPACESESRPNNDEPQTVKTFVAQTIDQWRTWLDEHHDSESEVWLIFYKRHTGVASIPSLVDARVQRELAPYEEPSDIEDVVRLAGGSRGPCPHRPTRGRSPSTTSG
jgi:hypothetical protein